MIRRSLSGSDVDADSREGGTREQDSGGRVDDSVP